MTAINVAVVRPKRSKAEWVVRVIGYIAGFFLTAWLLMLIAGVVTDWGLSFWRTVLIYLAVRLSLNWGDYLYWTHPWPKAVKT